MQKLLDEIIAEGETEVVVAFHNGHQFPGKLGRKGALYQLRSMGQHPQTGKIVSQDIVFQAAQVTFVARQAQEVPAVKGNGESRIVLPGGN
jgi:hypothetical protein